MLHSTVIVKIRGKVVRVVTESLSLSLSLSLFPFALCVLFGFYIVSGSVLHAILLIAALSSQIKPVPEG